MTVLEALIQSLRRAGEYNRDDQVAPAVILWPDNERQWEPVLPVLRKRLPHLLTLGPYAANCKTGPAIWLRCMIARTLPEANWPACAPPCDAVGRSHADRPEKTIPILYLPGVSRQELRAVAECPPELMPLTELQYRGAFWSQVNHKDWTVLAFLQSADGGLNLDADAPRVGAPRLRIQDQLNRVIHVDWSPDGRFLCFSRSPAAQGDPTKPGTSLGSCGLVGVHADGWNLCAVPADRDGILNLNDATEADFFMLTTNGCSNKEPAWFWLRRQTGE